MAVLAISFGVEFGQEIWTLLLAKMESRIWLVVQHFVLQRTNWVDACADAITAIRHANRQRSEPSA
jgi:hypothetical protein